MLPALEGATCSETVAENLNTLHDARRKYIELESSDKIRRALKHNVRTYADIHYSNGDLVYYKRADSERWHGPAKIIGKDSQQYLLKHASSTIRVHPCRLQPANKEIELHVNAPILNENTSVTENLSEERQPQFLNSCSDEEDEHSDNRDTETLLSNQNAVNERNIDLNESDEVVPTSENDPQIKITEQPQLKHHIKVKFYESDEWIPLHVISNAGKKSGKYSNWYNVQNLKDNQLMSINWDQVDQWLPISDYNETFVSSQSHENSDILNAKITELNKWKENNVYTDIQYTNQHYLSLRWVNTTKTVNGLPHVKSRSVVRGFEENDNNILTDSPTCYKYSLRLIFAVCVSKLWKIHSLDITTAFLQGRSIDRDIYVKPPKEAGVPDDKLWKLNVCVYGLGDASRQWHLTIVEKLKDLNVHPCKHDPAVFRYFSQGNLKGIISTHVDDFFYCGDADFHENIITALKSMFSIKTEHDSSFKYLGLNVVQNETDFSITIDQEEYISSLEKININSENPPDMPLNDDQLKNFFCLIGQLMWVANQTRPDILFDLCQLSSSCKNATQKDISIINKTVSKVKQ